MSNRFLTKFQVLLAKIESTYGSDPTPTAGANAKEVSNLIVNLNAEPEERDIHRNTLSQDAPIASKRFAEIQFAMELKGSGTPGTAPAIGDLLRACGMAESVGDDGGGSSSVVYTPGSSDHDSITVYRYQILDGTDCKLQKFVGSRGTFNIVLAAGKKAMIEFNFRAAISGADSDGSTPTPTYGETTKPPIVQSAAFSWNSVTALRCQALNLDIANEVVQDEDVNAAGAGLIGFIITGRKPNGRFNPDVIQISANNFKDEWENATERALSIVVGSTAGNICTITAPKCSIDSVSDEDLNGKAKMALPFRMNRNSADDELVLTFS